jgi:hypothetical protein
LILPDESEQDYEATRSGWMETYEPEGYHEIRVVEQLILNDWLLQRANRRLLETEASPQDEAYQHRVELMQRYRTTAERGFYRALNAVESLRKDRRRERLLLDALIEKYERENARLRANLGERSGSRAEQDAEPANAPAEDLQASSLPAPTPIAGIVTMPVVAGSNPVSSGVGGTAPIAGMPGVTGTARIPVPVDPDITGTRAIRASVNRDGRRRGIVADSGCRRVISTAETDAEGEMRASEQAAAGEQEQGDNFGFHNGSPQLRPG